MFKIIARSISAISAIAAFSSLAHAQLALPGSNSLQTLSAVHSVAPGALKSSNMQGMAKDMAINAAKERAKQEATGAISKSQIGQKAINQVGAAKGHLDTVKGHVNTAKQIGAMSGVKSDLGGNLAKKAKLPL